jgi:hypothetical protein
MPQGEDLHVLIPIARGEKPQGRERGSHRHVGQSPQHSRSSWRDDRLAVVTFVSLGRRSTTSVARRYHSHLHGRFRHAQRCRCMTCTDVIIGTRSAMLG